MRIIVGNTICKIVIGGVDNNLDFDIYKELRKYLRIRPDDYSHSTAYRRHQWDGYRYFITAKGSFATGFLPNVTEFLTSLGVLIEIVDERGAIPRLQFPLNADLGIIDGERWEARDYQMEVVKKIDNIFTVQGKEVYFPRGILDCATNAGKNSMAALLVKNLSSEARVIFLVSSVLIYEQAVEFFSQSLGYDVGQVNSKNLDFKSFTVAMAKTLLNRAKEKMTVKMTLTQMQVLIVDESDEAGSKEYSKLIQMVGAPMRIFLSGTPLNAGKVNNMIAIGLSGKVLAKITNRELIDKGVSQNPVVKILLNPEKVLGTLSYETEKTNIVLESKARVNAIVGILEAHTEGAVLITFNNIVHGEFMFERLCNALPHETIELAHGGSKERKEILTRFKTGETRILLASMIMKKGANISNIRTLIQAQGGKSVITVKQVIGRAIRDDGINDSVNVYDFYDQGRIVSKHSRDRIRIYKKEGFDVELTYQNNRLKPI